MKSQPFGKLKMVKKKRGKNKSEQITIAQESLKEIGEIEGISILKVCRNLGVPTKSSSISSKQVSGYNSTIKQYLRKIRKEGLINE